LFTPYFYQVVRRLHITERDVETKNRAVELLEIDIQSRQGNVTRAQEDIALERTHSDLLIQVMTKFRGEVLKMHLKHGNGADKTLQRTSFILARTTVARREQLKREERERKRSDERKKNKSKNNEHYQDQVMFGTNERKSVVELETAATDRTLLRNEEVLINSLRRLILDVKNHTKENLDALWERERRRHREDRHQLVTQNNKLRMQSTADRERSEYALSLVKAMKKTLGDIGIQGE
jgi:hypothetical protein